MADDGSEDDILSLLRDEFASCFPWVFVRVNVPEFEAATGVKRYFNNPALTNNIAFRHSRGDLVALMGNEIIVWKKCFDRLLADIPQEEDWLRFSTTYDLGQRWLDRLDMYGANLSDHIGKQAEVSPLHSQHYRSDVTNYLSVSPRSVWERLGGYDERYLGGISSDDSDFVRRARTLGVRTSIVTDAITFHQYHQGKTMYYDPPPEVITRECWDEGVRRNHAIYHAWNGSHHNPQPWPWGTFGVVEVINNFTKPNRSPEVVTA